MKWEYMTVMFKAAGFLTGGQLDGNAFNDELNKLGGQGWELVSVFHANVSHTFGDVVLAVFKRPTQ